MPFTRYVPYLLAGVCLLSGSAAARGPADETAVFTSADGGRRSGRLQMVGGRPVLLPADGSAPLPLAAIGEVRFPAARGSTSLEGGGWLLLAGRQRIPGRLEALDLDWATLSVAGLPARRLPRGVLVGATARREGVVAGIPYRRHDGRQDAVQLDGGEELFGRIDAVDRQRVRLTGPLGRMELDAGRIAAIGLADARLPPARLDGPIVRLALAAPPDVADASRDGLIGTLLAIDPQAFELEHPYLGRLAVPRRLVARLRLLHAGPWIEIEPRYRHLGNEARVDFDVAAAGGTRLELPFTLAAPPRADATLSLWLVELEPQGAGGRYETQLRAGHLRTTLLVNDREVDYLNHHVQRSTAQPQRVRIPLPAGALRAGPNRVVLLQTPQQDRPHEYDDCGVFGVALQIEATP